MLPLGAVFTVAGPASAASCNNPAKGNWSNNCTVGDGNASNLVWGVQDFVNTWEFNTSHTSCGVLTEDGIFGSATRAAVECYQSHNGLNADGIVGPLTWAKMYGHLLKDATSGSWAYYRYTPTGVDGAEYFKQWVPSGVWYTIDNNNGAWLQMNLSGPG
jgi:hypothetical protein